MNQPEDSVSHKVAVCGPPLAFSSAAVCSGSWTSWPERRSNRLQKDKTQPASYSQCQWQAPGHQRMLIERFTGNADQCVAYLFIRIPEETGKPLVESWKAAETGVCD